MPVDRAAGSLWGPLRVAMFRNLLVANVVSGIGTFMQSVGAAWLMVSLGASPMYLALRQTASTLPFFVLALPAGSIGDIVDRRRLILSIDVEPVNKKSAPGAPEARSTTSSSGAL